MTKGKTPTDADSESIPKKCARGGGEQGAGTEDGWGEGAWAKPPLCTSWGLCSPRSSRGHRGGGGGASGQKIQSGEELYSGSLLTFFDSPEPSAGGGGGGGANEDLGVLGEVPYGRLSWCR